VIKIHFQSRTQNKNLEKILVVPITDVQRLTWL